MNPRIAAGVGLLLALKAVDMYQLVLPPLYGHDTFDEQDVRQAAKFVAWYILIVAFATGVLTESPWPIFLPAIAIGLIFMFYMYEVGKQTNNAMEVDDD